MAPTSVIMMIADDTQATPATMIGFLHQRLVARRRVRVLASHLTALIPPGARILDVGCGDGVIDHLISSQRSDVSIQGIDVLVRKNAMIPVKQFDGITIPYPDASFDAVMLIDVLHHTVDPLAMIKEAQRVGGTLLIKDHFREGFLANTTLKLMDWVGNAHHGVALPYNYWSKSQWQGAFATQQMVVAEMEASLGLYHWPASRLFERGLHFVARVESSRSI